MKEIFLPQYYKSNNKVDKLLIDSFGHKANYAATDLITHEIHYLKFMAKEIITSY